MGRSRDVGSTPLARLADRLANQQSSPAPGFDFASLENRAAASKIKPSDRSCRRYPECTACLAGGHWPCDWVSSLVSQYHIASSGAGYTTCPPRQIGSREVRTLISQTNSRIAWKNKIPTIQVYARWKTTRQMLLRAYVWYALVQPQKIPKAFSHAVLFGILHAWLVLRFPARFQQGHCQNT